MSDKTRRYAYINAKTVRIISVTVMSIISLVILLLVGATYYLSPSRLEKIINQEASENLNADVHVSNPRFTLWSSFPHFTLEIDSIKVISRALNDLPDDLRKQLPENSDFLMSSGNLKGEINLMKLIKGEIHLGNITADALNLNLVMVSDSIANFNILNSEMPTGKVPYFTAKKIALTNPGMLSFYSLTPNVKASVDLKRLSAVRDTLDSTRYNTAIKGNLSFAMNGQPLLSSFPFNLHGPAKIAFNPMSIKVSDFKIDLGPLKGITNMAMVLEGESKIESLNYRLQELPISDLISLLPEGMIKWPASVKANPLVGLTAELTAPYPLNSENLPSIKAEVSLPAGEISYQEKNLPQLNIAYSPIEVGVRFNGNNPKATAVELQPFSIKGEGGELTLNPTLSDLSSNPHIILNLNGKYDASEAAKFFSALANYSLKGELTGKATVDFRKSDLNPQNLSHINVDADISLSNYSSKIPQANVSLMGDSLAIKAKGNMQDMALDLMANNFAISQGEDKVTLQGLSTSFKTKYSPKGVNAAPFVMPTKWYADSQAMAFAKHGSEYMTMALPAKFADIIKHWQTDLRVQVKSGTVVTPVMPLHNGFHDLDLQVSFDDINLKSLKMNSQDTYLSLNGKISDLRRFLTSRTPVPLNVDINLDVDTVFINQLAGAYNHGLKYTHGPSASFLTVIPDTLTSSDTITMLLPRNLNANINAHIMMTSYTNLHLYNLGTKVTLKDGILNVNDLNVNSDFGNLNLDYSYDTSDMGNLKMGFNGGLSDVELVNFFRNFHTLLLMMPQMRNLKGNLSISTDAKMRIFPNMYINLPSIWADVYVHGAGLTLHQDHFIRNLTRLMLIHGSDDIHIADLNIHGSIHDNLMQLYPFNIQFDRYKLMFGGINNFKGNMYYHLGIDKSPIPFAFGVNLMGSLKEPELHLGGASFSVKEGEKITNAIADERKANLLLELKCLVREMLAKAAEADKTPASYYVY